MRWLFILFLMLASISGCKKISEVPNYSATSGRLVCYIGNQVVLDQMVTNAYFIANGHWLRFDTPTQKDVETNATCFWNYAPKVESFAR